MRVSGATKKPLPRDVAVWIVTTAGMTRATRSSSAAGVSATPGAAAGTGAVRFCGTVAAGAAGGVVSIGGGDVICTNSGAVEVDATGDGDGAGWRLFIHQIVATIATAATASSPAIWVRMDPVAERRLGILVFSVNSLLSFTTKDTKDTKGNYRFARKYKVFPLCP